MGFYTNIAVLGDQILYRGHKNGRRVQEQVNYEPTLYVESLAPSQYKTLSGTDVKPFRPGSIKESRDYIRRYQNVADFPLYGNSDFIYQFIGDIYPDEVEYNPSLVRVAFLDIETTSNYGFPDADRPRESINVITIKVNDECHIFALGKFEITEELKDAHCHMYTDERTMLTEFVHIWNQLDFDILTGWNVKFFDVPYLVNRIEDLLGTDMMRRLSPWAFVKKKTVNTKYGEKLAFELFGIAILDYFDLYSTFTYVNQESYKLDHIAFVELGRKKLSYDEYDTMKEFYEKDFSKFVRYNYQDTILVEQLDDKLKLLELAFALTYTAKVNFQDVFSQVRTWDQIIYHYLRHENVVIPLRKPHNTIEDGEQIIGAYVKEPITGQHDWVVSFDLNSLYPHLIMQYNLSPETKSVLPRDFSITPDAVLNAKPLTMEAIERYKKKDLAVAANGTCYRRDVKGFLPALMEKFYLERKHFKSLMIDAQKRKQKNPDDESIDYEIAKWNNFQMVRKIQLNSAYGACANKYFRYFDVDIAEAITCSGQLSIRWIANKLNEYLNKTLGLTDYDFVVASDTDSVYLRMGELVKKVMPDETDKNKITDFLDSACSKVIQKLIDESYNELSELTNAYSNKMNMEREVIADKGIWTAKKRYMLNVYDSEGVRYAEPKLKIMGLETTRSSTPQIVRDKLKTAIRMIMTKTEDDLIKFVADFREEFMQLSIEEIAFPRGCNNLTKWYNRSTIWSKGTPIAVKGGLLHNHFIKEMGLGSKRSLIREGDKVKFVYLKEQNPYLGCNVMSFPSVPPKEFELEKYADYRKQFFNAFLEPLDAILTHIDWHYEHRNTLF